MTAEEPFDKAFEILGGGRRASGRCCADLKLDRFLSGEMQGEERATLDAHFAQSPACKARLDEIAADHAAFAAAPPVLTRMTPTSSTTPMTPMTSRARWARRFTGAGATLLAAAAVIFVVQRGDNPGEEVVRSKGNARGVLTVLVAHGDEVRTAGASEMVRPGDRLRFTVRVSNAQYVSVVSRDGGGAVTTYVPFDGGAMIHVNDVGVDVALPGSLELDDVLGNERLNAFFCDVAQPRSTLEAAVTSSAVVPGCSVDVFSLVKVAP